MLGSNQTISTSQTSTVQSNGGNITIGSGGTITTKVGITLFSAPSGCSPGTIKNAGTINHSTLDVIIQNLNMALMGSGTIRDGKSNRSHQRAGWRRAAFRHNRDADQLERDQRRSGAEQTTGSAVGGAAVNNAGAITTTFNNGGAITGGAGTGTSGAIAALTNSGAISGGAAVRKADLTRGGGEVTNDPGSWMHGIWD